MPAPDRLPVRGRAFYPSDEVEIAGAAREFARDGATGGTVRTSFCPDCGSSVYWTADRAPGLIGIAVGCFADPGQPHPALSIWERAQHPWAHADADRHLPDGGA